MPELPEGLEVERHLEPARPGEMLFRAAGLVVLTVFVALALLNVFGQRAVSSTTDASGTRFIVSAPTALRSGDLFQGRFTIEPDKALDHAMLVLDDGWFEGITINTIEPSPVSEASRDGKLTLDYGHVGAGTKMVAYLQFQANPTTVARRSQGVGLYDGERLIATIARTVTIFP